MLQIWTKFVTRFLKCKKLKTGIKNRCFDHENVGFTKMSFYADIDTRFITLTHGNVLLKDINMICCFTEVI